MLINLEKLCLLPIEKVQKLDYKEGGSEDFGYRLFRSNTEDFIGLEDFLSQLSTIRASLEGDEFDEEIAKQCIEEIESYDEINFDEVISFIREWIATVIVKIPISSEELSGKKLLGVIGRDDMFCEILAIDKKELIFLEVF